MRSGWCIGSIMMNTPLVRIIIPFSKHDLAEVALERLVQQTYPAEKTEILLVGPKSSSLASRWPIRAIETGPIYYPGEARNTGARGAAGEYFLFLDDDCEPASDWIGANWRGLEKTTMGALGGQISAESKACFAEC